MHHLYQGYGHLPLGKFEQQLYNNLKLSGMDIQKKCLAIVGTGQIGCSIGMAVKKHVALVTGTDLNQKHLQEAVQLGLVDVALTLREAIAYASIIVVATPVDVAIPLLAQILDLIDSNTLVVDVGSTKLQVCNALRQHINRRNYVAAHPMAGSSVQGPKGALPKLFDGAKTFICEPQLSSDYALDTAKELFHCLNSRVEFIDPDEHDRLVGLVSHLPQALAYSLCNVVKLFDAEGFDWKGAAATAFDSTTRLAGSSSSVWLPIMNQNRENLLKYITATVGELHKLQQYLESNNIPALETYIDIANQVRNQLEESKKTPTSNSNGKRSTSTATAA